MGGQIVSIPSRGSGKGDGVCGSIKGRDSLVSIPSRGSGKGDTNVLSPKIVVFGLNTFVIPRETREYTEVSIPSRGSGKGDSLFQKVKLQQKGFQSPLGEVVKETKTR